MIDEIVMINLSTDVVAITGDNNSLVVVMKRLQDSILGAKNKIISRHGWIHRLINGICVISLGMDK